MLLPVYDVLSQLSQIIINCLLLHQNRPDSTTINCLARRVTQVALDGTYVLYSNVQQHEA